MKEAQHPVDFSPYLDGEQTDARYEQLRAHVETCSACRTQLQSWRAVDNLFRSPGLDIEVSPWQWSRIESRIEASRSRPGWLPALRRLAPRFGWAAAASLILFASAAVGIRHYRYSAEQETLLALSSYSEAEQSRLKNAANPFRSDRSSSGNPFNPFQLDRTQNLNPFVRR